MELLQAASAQNYVRMAVHTYSRIGGSSEVVQVLAYSLLLTASRSLSSSRVLGAPGMSSVPPPLHPYAE